ncbi:MAG: SMC family ATPase [Actinomycetia bacterium]|nr:SMC family ATPase [Actinomycetes bacterium]
MRPLRLEVQGFTAFREPTVVDFEGADLFALVGPTGSGKSSLIDAMIFALYGSVPRYDDTRLVAPVISQGMAEARVRLDFAVGSEQYVAVRVVRRTARGATTKEARLERVRADPDTEVIAGTQAELTDEVERLLGLTFNQFTTCVVLPQGEAARFLHEKPKDRQDLLVRLLDLGLYEKLASQARERARVAQAAESALERTLAELGAPAPEAIAQAEARMADLDRVVGTLDDLVPRVTEADVATAAAQAEASRLEGAHALLIEVGAPGGVTDLAGAVTQADELVAQARAAHEQVDGVVVDAEKGVAGGPDRAALDTQLGVFDRITELEQRVTKGQAMVAQAASAVGAAVAGRDAAAHKLSAARASLADIEVAHRAEALVAQLVPGEACPVCQQIVTHVPHQPATDLDRARSVVVTAEEEHRAAADIARQTEADATRYGALLADRESELAQVRESAQGVDREAVVSALTEAARLSEALDGARADSRLATQELRSVEQGRERLESELTAARRQFDATRDRVAALGPPEAERADLAADWDQLVVWAAGRVCEVSAELAGAQQALVAARSQLAAVQDEAGELVRGVGLDVGGQASVSMARDTVVAARAGAAADQTRMVSDAERAADLATEHELVHRRFLVADRLGRLLGARGFEKWLLDAAVDQLLAGANEILGELSGGQYSLVLDERGDNFMVIDHPNAGEVRLARTLSGGETFLASLALALSLADQVASLSATGAVRLESMILDEGFGTLDPDTLDVVATAIEELGASGRMVGVVSHVRELAERIPTRFEVRTGPRGSSVERVEM